MREEYELLEALNGSPVRSVRAQRSDRAAAAAAAAAAGGGATPMPVATGGNPLDALVGPVPRPDDMCFALSVPVSVASRRL